MKSITVLSVVLFIILAMACLTSARPGKTQSLSRHKRQSDQRLAELETLLALQRRHRFRMDRKKGGDGEHIPGYGIVDFRQLGRKKKSLRFSPGEYETRLEEQRNSFPEAEPYHLPHSEKKETLTIVSSEEENIYPDHVPIRDRSHQADPIYVK